MWDSETKNDRTPGAARWRPMITSLAEHYSPYSVVLTEDIDRLPLTGVRRVKSNQMAREGFLIMEFSRLLGV